MNAMFAALQKVGLVEAKAAPLTQDQSERKYLDDAKAYSITDADLKDFNSLLSKELSPNLILGGEEFSGLLQIKTPDLFNHLKYAFGMDIEGVVVGAGISLISMKSFNELAMLIESTGVILQVSYTVKKLKTNVISVCILDMNDL